ncbi:MAG: Lycopene cyclase [Spirochaetaceae bacterium]|nr:MAG: Lycopene cyclase [Spirochaetaceae bacterium]
MAHAGAVSADYDFILAGGGGAGLSLAWHLVEGGFEDSRILIVDEEDKSLNDRTWCYWVTGDTPFDGIARKSWDTLQITGDGKDLVLPLAPYRYQMLRSEDFYRFVKERLAACPHVEILTATVDQVRDTDDGAEIVAGGRTCRGRWVFDSLWKYQNLVVDESKYRNLKQHFKGVEIRLPQDFFDVDVARMFDFRTPQHDVMRFFYVLPWSPREALVEYTLFSPQTLPPEEYDRRIRDYIHGVLGITDYEITAEESCIIPMTDQPFERSGGRHILRTGTRGGRVKASTGYAFMRMQWDSEAIVDSLKRTGHPFDLPRTPPRYFRFDSILLQVLLDRGDLAEHVFVRFFDRNPVTRMFRFLDEEGGIGENLKLMSTVPIPTFLKAGWRVIRS